MASFWYLYCQLWTYFTRCVGVSIVGIEQLNAGRLGGWMYLKLTVKATYCCHSPWTSFIVSAGCYMFKLNSRTSCEIFSKLTIKTPERLVSLLLTLNLFHTSACSSVSIVKCRLGLFSLNLFSLSTKCFSAMLFVRLNFFGNNFHKITASNQIIIYGLFRFIDTN